MKEEAYGFFDLAELFEFGAECSIVSVPCKATTHPLDFWVCATVYTELDVEELTR